MQGLKGPSRGLAIGAAIGVGLLALSGGVARAAPAAGEVVVFEAASLKEAFAHLAAVFEKENAGAKVVANAAGSQELRTQLEHGASADVFASADHKHMDALVGEKLVGAPVVFACNEPVIVVRLGLTAKLQALADLPNADRIVVGVPEVPIGAYTLQILQKAAGKLGADFPKRVELKVASRELNVKQVLAKVVLGEADAAIVYRSDAAAAKDKVRVVTIPADLNVVAEYPIAAVAAAPHAALARRFIELVRSSAGAAELRASGFVPCPTK